MTLPFEPIWRLALVAAPQIIHGNGSQGSVRAGVATVLGTTTRSIDRYKSDGEISANVADGLAVKLGLHPAEIWGQDWWDAEPEPEHGTVTGFNRERRSGEVCNLCRKAKNERQRQTRLARA